MRIVPANTKPLFCRVYKHMYICHSKANTEISVCFDPIIYPPGSQLAGRLVRLAHGFLVCPIRSSYMSRQRWQRSVQLSSIET